MFPPSAPFFGPWLGVRCVCLPAGKPASGSTVARPVPVSWSSSVGLAGHRPHGDDVGGEQDEGEDQRRSQQARTTSGVQSAYADATGDQRDEQDETARVGDDVADAEPCRLVDVSATSSQPCSE